MGCAELGAYLYGHYLTFCSSDPTWPVRDRFILSAGHGSALQYVCLHLSGFDLSMSDLQRFRQLHSKTPGHPESDVNTRYRDNYRPPWTGCWPRSVVKP